MKGELRGLVAVVASWLSGYGNYSQTPCVRVPQLSFFLFSPFSSSRLISNETVSFIFVYCFLLLVYEMSTNIVHMYVHSFV